MQELIAAAWQKGEAGGLHRVKMARYLAETCKLQESECCESGDDLKIALLAANAV